MSSLLPWLSMTNMRNSMPHRSIYSDDEHRSKPSGQGDDNLRAKELGADHLVRVKYVESMPLWPMFQ